MHLKNLYVSHKAFKVGRLPSGEVLTQKEASAPDGTLVISGNSRKAGVVTMQISKVVGNHLVPIATFAKEFQVELLELVKTVIHQARLSAVFLYEIAFQRSALRSLLAAEHRLQTLPHEVEARHRKVNANCMYQLGSRAMVVA
jgi:hypothetical protein